MNQAIPPNQPNQPGQPAADPAPSLQELRLNRIRIQQELDAVSAQLNAQLDGFEHEWLLGTNPGAPTTPLPEAP